MGPKTIIIIIIIIQIVDQLLSSIANQGKVVVFIWVPGLHLSVQRIFTSCERYSDMQFLLGVSFNLSTAFEDHPRAVEWALLFLKDSGLWCGIS